ncbi:hypothetical protein MRY87_11705 [bacterium]|nr:hypothetical protein [bacterium]
MERPPLQTTSVSPVHLREVRKVLIAPMHIGPSAIEALSHEVRLEQLLEEYAVGKLRVESVFGEEVMRSARKTYGNRRPTARERHQLMEEFGANAFLETELLHYAQREGSRVGALQPAEVVMNFRLFGGAATNTRDGYSEPIWEANYSFRDKALTDDLLSVQKRFSAAGNEGGSAGAGWKGATALVENSIKMAFRELEREREQSFAVDRGVRR